MPDRALNRRVAVVVLVLGLALAGCGGRAEPSKAPSSPKPAQATAAPAGSVALVIDRTLLGVLPAQVAGVVMVPADETAAGMIKDPALQRSASGIAVGLVVAPGASGDDDMAVSTVVRLRPGVNDDAFYADWRHAYDESACEPAGGVASHVQQRIGPHAVEVTVCGGGARLYHTRLAGDRLVSITAVGGRTFGDLVMAGLRE